MTAKLRRAHEDIPPIKDEKMDFSRLELPPNRRSAHWYEVVTWFNVAVEHWGPSSEPVKLPRRYLSMRGRLSRRRGCTVGPRVAATCRPSGSAVPASREKLSISPRHWFGCGIERGLSYPACETRDGRCAPFRFILGQGAEVAERPKFSNGRERGNKCAA